ncbi:MAG: IS30 family transposase [Anaerovoracaceae bacterium]
MGACYSHLTWNDRLTLDKMLRAGYSKKEIAKVIGCSFKTVYNELKRAKYVRLTTHLLEVESYNPEGAEKRYQENLKAKGKELLAAGDKDFLSYIEEKIVDEKYSPGAALMELQKEKKEFSVSVKSVNTIYKYIREGVFERLKMEHLPIGEKKKRNGSVKRASRSSKGTSIEKRSEEVLTRIEFGHWEMDTVKGKRENGKTLLVLTERKTRWEIIEVMKKNSTKETVRALNRIEKRYKSFYYRLFKSITVDNGPEFQDFEAMENALYRVGERSKLYYCHPYCSFERGSNENQNRFIRRWLPKGSDFDVLVNKKEIKRIQDWVNNYPRGMFGGKSSEELFYEECIKLRS